MNLIESRDVLSAIELGVYYSHSYRLYLGVESYMTQTGCITSWLRMYYILA